jgi:hypothetical protein
MSSKKKKALEMHVKHYYRATQDSMEHPLLPSKMGVGNIDGKEYWSFQYGMCRLS